MRREVKFCNNDKFHAEILYCLLLVLPVYDIDINLMYTTTRYSSQLRLFLYVKKHFCYQYLTFSLSHFFADRVVLCKRCVVSQTSLSRNPHDAIICVCFKYYRTAVFFVCCFEYEQRIKTASQANYTSTVQKYGRIK